MIVTVYFELGIDWYALLLQFLADGGDVSFPEPTADTMLEFRLKVKCKHNFRAPKGSEDPKELYHHSNGKKWW